MHAIFQKERRTACLLFCTPAGARTLDTLIKSQVLYQLSYGCILLFSGCKDTFFDSTKLFGDFLHKKLFTGTVKALQVLITALHHTIIDVPDP